jgi:hypothetical protein
MEQIIQNGILVKDTGEILLSTHRHDFQKILVGPDKIECMVDGGLAYIRRGFGYSASEKEWLAREPETFYAERKAMSDYDIAGLVEEVSLSNESTAEDVAKYLCWGTRGKDGTEPLKHIFIKDCTQDHLDALLEYTKTNPIAPIHLEVMKYWQSKKSIPKNKKYIECLRKIESLVKAYKAHDYSSSI